MKNFNLTGNFLKENPPPIIKECPFCGSQAVCSSAERYGWTSDAVECENEQCGAQGPGAETERESILKWNQRQIQLYQN